MTFERWSRHSGAGSLIAAILEQTDDERSVLLATMESNVIALPHELHALSRAISGDRVRYLLADEARLVMRELKQKNRDLLTEPTNG